ncbi:MAG TPA: hypothetical protein VFN49_08565 [Candidatus Aquilonibacter sp.]|nr:hypothetical protein [Candidatus Aquilonibacter sp.]
MFSRIAAALTLAVACAAGTARAGEAASPAKNYAGVQLLLIAGQHQDIAGTQKGIGAGPLLQVRAGGRRLAGYVEGIPVVGIPNVPPSASYGQATPHLGIFNGELEYAPSANRTWWVALGETVYNQRTPLPAQDQSVSSRLAGVRYGIRYLRALTTTKSIEAFVGAAPTLTGSDVYVGTDGSLINTKPERASEVDASLALAYRHGGSEWLFGVRSLNFAAKFVNTGEAADRNVGIGPMIEWRHIFR